MYYRDVSVNRFMCISTTTVQLMSPDHIVEDAALWHCYQQGDPSALGQLMAAHYVSLLHYGTRFTRDTDRIRDCMQDVFVELWNRRDNLSQLTSGQVKPYLMTMLRRLLHEEHLNQQRFTLNSLTDESDQLPVALSPEEQLIGAEMALDTTHRIHLLIGKLPQRAKEAIHLRFFSNLERKDVAQIMGISEQSVSNLIQEAFRQLRQHTTAEQFWLVLLVLFAA